MNGGIAVRIQVNFLNMRNEHGMFHSLGFEQFKNFLKHFQSFGFLESPII